MKIQLAAPLRVTISDGDTFFKREFMKLKKKKKKKSQLSGQRQEGGVFFAAPVSSWLWPVLMCKQQFSELEWCWGFLCGAKRFVESSDV